MRIPVPVIALKKDSTRGISVQSVNIVIDMGLQVKNGENAYPVQRSRI